MENKHGGANRGQGRKKGEVTKPVRMTKKEYDYFNSIKSRYINNAYPTEKELELITWFRTQKMFLYIEDSFIVKQMGLEFRCKGV